MVLICIVVSGTIICACSSKVHRDKTVKQPAANPSTRMQQYAQSKPWNSRTVLTTAECLPERRPDPNVENDPCYVSPEPLAAAHHTRATDIEMCQNVSYELLPHRAVVNPLFNQNEDSVNDYLQLQA